jgi:hypothetical protein
MYEYLEALFGVALVAACVYLLMTLLAAFVA